MEFLKLSSKRICWLLLLLWLAWSITLRRSFFFFFGGRRGINSSLKPSDRLGVCFIRVLMLNYKNIASVSVILLNCVEVTGIRVLHVKGDTECFNWWQVIVAVFFSTWILFFPLSLKLSYAMFIKNEITFPKFIICLMIPIALVVYKIVNRNVVSVVLQKPVNVLHVKKSFERNVRRVLQTQTTSFRRRKHFL